MLRRRSSRSGVLLCVALAISSVCAAAFAADDPGPGAAAPLTREELEAEVKACEEIGSDTPIVRLRQVESGFIDLLEADPADEAVLGDLAGFYKQWRVLLRRASPEALQLITSSTEPIDLAWNLHHGADELGADFLLAALSRQPDDPAMWLQAPGGWGRARVRPYPAPAATASAQV